MKNKKAKSKPSAPSQSAGKSSKGAAAKPHTKKQEKKTTENGNKTIGIGIPVSEEEYKKLKEQSKKI